MKKSTLVLVVLSLVLVLVLSMAFFACNNNKPKDNGNDNGNGTEIPDNTPTGLFASGSVTLIDDYVLSEVDWGSNEGVILTDAVSVNMQNHTLDLGGKKITVTSDKSDCVVSFKNGTLTNGTLEIIVPNGDIEMTGVTLDKSLNYTFQAAQETIRFNNATISGKGSIKSNSNVEILHSSVVDITLDGGATLTAGKGAELGAITLSENASGASVNITEEATVNKVELQSAATVTVAGTVAEVTVAEKAKNSAGDVKVNINPTATVNKVELKAAAQVDVSGSVSSVKVAESVKSDSRAATVVVAAEAKVGKVEVSAPVSVDVSGEVLEVEVKASANVAGKTVNLTVNESAMVDKVDVQAKSNLTVSGTIANVVVASTAEGSAVSAAQGANVSTIVVNAENTTIASAEGNSRIGIYVADTISSVNTSLSYETKTQEELEGISVHVHNFVYQSSEPATCTEDGSVTYVCEDDGITRVVTVNKLGHNYRYSVTTKPTATTKGVGTYTCTRCGATKTVELDCEVYIVDDLWKEVFDNFEDGSYTATIKFELPNSDGTDVGINIDATINLVLKNGDLTGTIVGTVAYVSKSRYQWGEVWDGEYSHHYEYYDSVENLQLTGSLENTTLTIQFVRESDNSDDSNTVFVGQLPTSVVYAVDCGMPRNMTISMATIDRVYQQIKPYIVQYVNGEVPTGNIESVLVDQIKLYASETTIDSKGTVYVLNSASLLKLLDKTPAEVIDQLLGAGSCADLLERLQVEAQKENSAIGEYLAEVDWDALDEYKDDKLSALLDKAVSFETVKKVLENSMISSVKASITVNAAGQIVGCGLSLGGAINVGDESIDLGEVASADLIVEDTDANGNTVYRWDYEAFQAFLAKTPASLVDEVAGEGVYNKIASYLDGIADTKIQKIINDVLTVLENIDVNVKLDDVLDAVNYVLATFGVEDFDVKELVSEYGNYTVAEALYLWNKANETSVETNDWNEPDEDDDWHDYAPAADKEELDTEGVAQAKKTINDLVAKVKKYAGKSIDALLQENLVGETYDIVMDVLAGITAELVVDQDGAIVSINLASVFTYEELTHDGNETVTANVSLTYSQAEGKLAVAADLFDVVVNGKLDIKNKDASLSIIVEEDTLFEATAKDADKNGVWTVSVDCDGIAIDGTVSKDVLAVTVAQNEKDLGTFTARYADGTAKIEASIQGYTFDATIGQDNANITLADKDGTLGTVVYKDETATVTVSVEDIDVVVAAGKDKATVTVTEDGNKIVDGTATYGETGVSINANVDDYEAALSLGVNPFDTVFSLLYNGEGTTAKVKRITNGLSFEWTLEVEDVKANLNGTAVISKANSGKWNGLNLEAKGKIRDANTLIQLGVVANDTVVVPTIDHTYVDVLRNLGGKGDGWTVAYQESAAGKYLVVTEVETFDYGTETTVYKFDVENDFPQVMALMEKDCGDWYYLDIIGVADITKTVKYVKDSEAEEDAYSSEANIGFYYNAKTKAIANASQHNYKLSVVYDGEKDCNQGYTLTKTCSACGVSESDHHFGHYYAETVEEPYVTECGTSTVRYRECLACGARDLRNASFNNHRWVGGYVYYIGEDYSTYSEESQANYNALVAALPKELVAKAVDSHMTLYTCAECGMKEFYGTLHLYDEEQGCRSQAISVYIYKGSEWYDAFQYVNVGTGRQEHSKMKEATRTTTAADVALIKAKFDEKYPGYTGLNITTSNVTTTTYTCAVCGELCRTKYKYEVGITTLYYYVYANGVYAYGQSDNMELYDYDTDNVYANYKRAVGKYLPADCGIPTNFNLKSGTSYGNSFYLYDTNDNTISAYTWSRSSGYTNYEVRSREGCLCNEVYLRIYDDGSTKITHKGSYYSHDYITIKSDTSCVENGGLRMRKCYRCGETKTTYDGAWHSTYWSSDNYTYTIGDGKYVRFNHYYRCNYCKAVGDVTITIQGDVTAAQLNAAIATYLQRYGFTCMYDVKVMLDYDASLDLAGEDVEICCVDGTELILSSWDKENVAQIFDSVGGGTLYLCTTHSGDITIGNVNLACDVVYDDDYNA